MERSILEWSVRALLMAVGVGVALPLLRIRQAALRHAAWTAVLIAMLLLPAWTQWGPSVAAPVLPAPEENATRLNPEPLPPTSLEKFAPFRIPRTVQGAPIVAPATAPVTEPIAEPIDWTRILAALYLLGVMAMLVRLTAGTFQIRRMMRRSRQADEFRVTSNCGAPVTAGWLRPVVLLPEDWRSWPAAKLDAVLIHEREHIRRRDPLVQWLALLNRCIFWFHPLAWWLERKVASLAEEACDAAVLRHGYTAQDYSNYLIEIARTVNARGSRLRWAGSVAFSSGKLAQRIRRMMEAPAAVPASRTMQATATVWCALLLGACLACNVGHSPGVLPGQPTMAELAKFDRVRGLELSDMRNRTNEQVAFAASHLTDADAKELDAVVRSHPEDLDNLGILTGHYQRKHDTGALQELTLWYIAHRPDARRNWAARPSWDHVWNDATYARGRELWLAQAKKSWDTPWFYMNAAEFLSGHDNEQAEQILQEGRRRFPTRGLYSGLHWEVFLARHYAWALEGGSGQLPAEHIVASRPSFSPDTPYAQKVRAMLAASNDTELLFRAVEQLQMSPPNRQFAVALSDRLLTLNAIEPFYHRQNIALKEQQRLTEIRRVPGVRTESQRMALLLNGLPWYPAPMKVREAEAWTLLKLASNNPKDPNYGTAVFAANMILGAAALDRGDKQEAVRRLRAASEAPPTETLRYTQLEMLLPSRLIDAGEREAVAGFLDRCAKFNVNARDFSDWAAKIRRGINPRIGPMYTLYRPV